jgi:hypothetical protein
MQQEERVLGRVGARTLTFEETERVAGAINSRICTLARTTGFQAGDGDCSLDHDLDVP